MREIKRIKVKEYKQKHKITNARIARELDVTQDTVRNWDKGRAMPTVYHLLGLSEIFNCLMDDLIERKYSVN